MNKAWLMIDSVCEFVKRDEAWRRSLMRVGACAVFAMVLATRAGAQVASAVAPPAKAPESITIDRAIEEANAHNLDLFAKRLDVPIAEARAITARLRQIPILSLDADQLDVLGTGFYDVNGGGPTEYAWRIDVPIERGGKRDARIGEASAESAVAAARIEDAVRTLDATVEQACIDVVQATDNLAVARETLRTFEDLATLNDQRVSAGAAAPYEATRTRVAMLQFRADVSRAELDVRASSLKLRELLGRPPSSDPIEVVAPLPAVTATVPDLPALEALAVDHRADLRAAKLDEARSAADIKLQIAQGKVDFTWGGEYRRQAGPTSFSNSAGFFFSAPLPFSDRNQGEIARASTEREQLTRETAAVDATVRGDVHEAYDALVSARALVTSIEQDLLGLAQSSKDIATYTYRAGGSTLVELLDSERAWNDTMQSYHDAQADYRRAVARLNAAVGTEVIR